MNWYYKRDKYISQNAYDSSDGLYHYYIGGLELICETNVWDYIYEDGGYLVYNFSKFASDIGLTPIRMIEENQYINEVYADYVNKVSASGGVVFSTVTNDYEYNIYKFVVINEIGGYFAKTGIAESEPYDDVVYRIGDGQKTWSEAMSFNSVVVCTYILERTAKGDDPNSIMQYFDSWESAVFDMYRVIPK